MALTVDCTSGVGSNARWDGVSKLYVRKAEVDVGGTLIVAAGTKTSSDVYQALDIPANTYVLGAWFVVTEAEATNVTATFALGDGSNTAGYVAAATCAVVDTPHCSGGTDVYNAYAGKFYTSADTIDLLVATAAFTNVVVDVYALCCDLE